MASRTKRIVSILCLVAAPGGPVVAAGEKITLIL